MKRGQSTQKSSTAQPKATVTAMVPRGAQAVARVKAAADATPQTVVDRLIDLAKDPAIDVVKINALLDANERVMKMQAKAAFETAFAKMQGQIPIINRDGQIIVDGQVRSTFATNANIQKVVRPIMSEHGFSLRFRHRREGGELVIIGILSHVGGHSEEDEFITTRDDSGKKNAIQSWGSARSYGERYVTRSLLNIADENEDTDGVMEGETHPSYQRPAPRTSRPAPKPQAQTGRTPENPAGGKTPRAGWMDEPITVDQRKHLVRIVQNSGRIESTFLAWLKETFGAASTKDIKRGDFDAVVSAVESDGPLVTMGSEDDGQ